VPMMEIRFIIYWCGEVFFDLQTAARSTEGCLLKAVR
jgi:hypothetical protein